jgi:hypothetical protein
MFKFLSPKEKINSELAIPMVDKPAVGRQHSLSRNKVYGMTIKKQ